MHPPPGASNLGGGGGMVKTSRGFENASGAPLGSHATCTAGSPLSWQSAGIHSPWHVCHCSTPPGTLHTTLFYTKLSPNASFSVVCCWSAFLALPADPAYLLAYTNQD